MKNILSEIKIHGFGEEQHPAANLLSHTVAEGIRHYGKSETKCGTWSVCCNKLVEGNDSGITHNRPVVFQGLFETGVTCGFFSREYAKRRENHGRAAQMAASLPLWILIRSQRDSKAARLVLPGIPPGNMSHSESSKSASLKVMSA